ncbi:MAG: arsenate reductase family protein [Brevinematales bacterium]|nr:arsenate reductase family protein [Brevinematales bacterium]
MASQIQIFGVKKSFDTQKAERFFKERRVSFHFVDLKEKGFSPGELRSISEILPWDMLIDTKSSLYQQRQMQYLVVDWFEEVLAHPTLVRMPIVRWGKRVTVGYTPEIWKEWLTE